jgi:hypothetical protein
MKKSTNSKPHGQSIMPRYYFNIRDGDAGLSDPDGTELPDAAVAASHALVVARELMQHNEAAKRHWRLDVCNADGKLLFELPFAQVDRSLDHLDTSTRRLIEQISESKRVLGETLFDARVTLLRARALLDRFEGRPHIATFNGLRL